MTEEIPLFFSELIKRETELTDKIDEELIKTWMTRKTNDPRLKKVVSLSSKGVSLNNIKMWFQEREIPLGWSNIVETRKRARVRGEF